jgi:hypothetical protein
VLPDGFHDSPKQTHPQRWFRAGNSNDLAFAPQPLKYRTFLSAPQQRLYGRWRVRRLRFLQRSDDRIIALISLIGPFGATEALGHTGKDLT